MDEGEVSERFRAFGAGQNLRPRSATYYLSFSKAKKKIGSVATKEYFQVKDFLIKEIPLPSSRHIIRSIENLLKRGHPSIHFLRNRHFVKKESRVSEEVDSLIKRSNEVLAEATTVFPFTLFTDTITLDRRKLTLTQRTFFMSSKVLSIDVEEILNITSSVGPLFGSLNIAIRGLTSEDHFTVNYLWRKDAIHMKHMIHGYVLALKDKIDLESLSQKELVKILAELGHDSNFR